MCEFLPKCSNPMNRNPRLNFPSVLEKKPQKGKATTRERGKLSYFFWNPRLNFSLVLEKKPQKNRLQQGKGRNCHIYIFLFSRLQNLLKKPIRNLCCEERGGLLIFNPGSDFLTSSNKYPMCRSYSFVRGGGRGAKGFFVLITEVS